MESYTVDTVIASNGSLNLNDLPFKEGEVVEVIIFTLLKHAPSEEKYPLRGSVIRYDDPFKPVAVNDWEITQ